MDMEKIILALSEMTILASRYRNRIIALDPGFDNSEDDDAIDRAWDLFEDAKIEQQIANAPEDNDEDNEPPDFETLQAERDQREYEAGKAEAETRRAERRIYGDALAEQFHLQDDINAFNRGDE